MLLTLVVCLVSGFVRTQDPQVISDASDVSRKQVIYNKPIVIHTQLDNYEQPTLREYQECHENADKCHSVCKGVKDVEACDKQCPICPDLIKEEKVVQGVNDTLAGPQPVPLNTTNIIRLTNQIHNMIDNSRGNITYRNDNVLHLHQNISRVGGKFGLGYNDSDQCCIILRPKRQCDAEKFSTAARCHRKRHRVCGPQCKARVMLAKVVTECDQPDPMDYFNENVQENCRQTVKYVPYRQRRATRNRNKCGYIPYWPFVACLHGQHSAVSSSSCSGCMRLPYAYILRNGIPMQCQPCFRAISGPNYNGFYAYGSYAPPPMWYPNMGPPMTNYPQGGDNSFDFDVTDDWTPDKVKCITAEGTISEDCAQIEGSGADMPPVTGGPTIVGDYEDDYDYPADEPVVRPRRQTFSRSKYSRRYRGE